MRAIVLAAGTGSRLGEMTRVRTKGMVPVGGKRLIDHLFDFFDMDFFDEVIVVGGFCYQDLRDHIQARGLSKVRVIENPDYLKGNIFTLLTALKQFNGDSFLITNVDHIYPRAMFEKMKPSMKGITGMVDFDRPLGDDDMKVKLTPDRHISRISKALSEFDCGYIGMTYVDKTADALYRAAAQRTVEKTGEKAVVENILQLLAEEGNPAPSICDLSGLGWFEVDTPEDHAKAEAGMPEHPLFR